MSNNYNRSFNSGNFQQRNQSHKKFKGPPPRQSHASRPRLAEAEPRNADIKIDFQLEIHAFPNLLTKEAMIERLSKFSQLSKNLQSLNHMQLTHLYYKKCAQRSKRDQLTVLPKKKVLLKRKILNKYDDSQSAVKKQAL